jgi:hypothetical protein
MKGTGLRSSGSEPTVAVGSLSPVSGLIEVITELNGLVGDPEVRDKWVEFCRLYKATRDEQAEATGQHRGHLKTGPGRSSRRSIGKSLAHPTVPQQGRGANYRQPE